MDALQMYWAYVKFLCNRYKKSPKLVTTNSNGAEAGPTIMYASHEALISVMDFGYREYAGVEWVWEGYGLVQEKVFTHYSTGRRGQRKIHYRRESNLTGIMAVWMLALHEFGHVMDSRHHVIGTRKHPSKTGHDIIYQNILATLIVECPYEEFLDVVQFNPKGSTLVVIMQSSIDDILAKYIS